MDEELADNLAALERAARLSAKQRNLNLSIVAEEIAEHAYTNGLQNEELLRVISVVTVKSFLDQTTTTTLIKNLYPVRRVPSDAVIAVVGALGTSKTKPSVATQALLVKWLGSVTDVLAEPAILSKLYGVLFDLLDMISLRNPLCYVLSLITRRRHIRQFRVQRLLELCQQTGNDPALIGLLQVYKNFLPEIITGNVAAKRFSFASQANIEWKKHLQAIQKYAPTHGDALGSNGFSVQHAPKRSTLLTDVRTYHAEENTVTLEEIQDVEGLVNNLEKIDPPSQIVTALRDPLLQRYLALKPSAEVSRRIHFWLSTYYEDELEILRQGFGVSPTLTEILDAVLVWTESTKTLDNNTLAFIQKYLSVTQGEANSGLLLDLLAFVSPQSFPDMHRNIFIHIERSVMTNASTPFDTLLDFYTKLAGNWLISLLAAEQSDTDTDSSKITEIKDSYTNLYNHISTLSISASIPSDKSNLHILSFYDTQAVLTLKALQAQSGAVPILMPPSQLIHLLTFSPSLADLSALCSLLSTYKQIFALAVKSRPRTTGAGGPGANSEVSTKTRQFNSHLMDALNLLWRSKALAPTTFAAAPAANGDDTTTATNNSLASEPLTRELQDYTQKLDREYSVASYYGLPFNTVTVSLARDALVRIEDQQLGNDNEEPAVRHAGPASGLSLRNLAREGGVDVSWKDYRIAVLDLLAELGAPAVRDFVFANMRDLQR